MHRLIERFYLDRYLSTSLILGIDMGISFLASLCSLSMIRLCFPHLSTVAWFPVLWLTAGAVCSFLLFYLLKTYHSVIRHSTLHEMGRFVAAALGKALLLTVTVALVPGFLLSDPCVVGLLLLDALLTLCLLVVFRIGMVVVYDILKNRYKYRWQCQRILVYGTGYKSVAAVTRLRNSPHYRVVGFLTCTAGRKRRRILEYPVYGFETRQDVETLCDRHDIDAVLFSSEEEARAEQERLLKYATEGDLRILITPPLDEIIDGKLMKQSVREIKIEDLLGRPEIKISMDEIVSNFRGKTVLVTGAAGSIGAELCRQLANFGVEQLILFDNAETPMHNIRLELEERYPALRFVPVIGDVRIPARLDFVFRKYRPQIVFHAAAYKHVPLMEENPCEAVLTNVAGTRNVADRCLVWDVEKMVMISTDKAVNPTNIMGCTKRLAEIYVQSLGLAIEQGRAKGKTRFVTTRFGNVLGSNGSVIPRFREQIAKGGPVTVLLHDHSRSVPARDGGGDDLLRQSDFRVRHGRERQNRQPGPPDDRTGGAGARKGYPDRLHRSAARRKAVRGGALQYGKYAAHFARPHSYRKGSRVRLRTRLRGGGRTRQTFPHRRDPRDGAAHEAHRSRVPVEELPFRRVRCRERNRKIKIR